jgi:hypothetical protein
MKQFYGKNWSEIKKVETEVEKLASNKAGSAGTKKRAGNKKGRILQEKNNKGWTKSFPGHIISSPLLMIPVIPWVWSHLGLPVKHC